MSIRAMSAVWEVSKHKGGDLLALLALADYANEDNEAWPSVKALSRKARMKERNVQYCLRKIEKSGEIKKLRSGGMIEGRKVTAKYQILLTGANFAGVVSRGAKSGTVGVQPIAPNPSDDPPLVLLSEEADAVPFLSIIQNQFPVLNTLDIVTAWGNYVADRKERRKPVTTRAAKMLLKKLTEQPGKVVIALHTMIERGWSGLQWDWLEGKNYVGYHRSKVSPAIPENARPGNSVREQQKLQQRKS